MNDNEDGNIEDFPTVIADGVNTHFMEGFVSMLFYQDKVFPHYQNKNETIQKITTERNTLFDVRLSINVLKTLLKDLDDGFKLYRSVSLIQDPRDFWVGIRPYEKESKLANRSPDEIEFDNALWGSFHEVYTGLSEEG